jgi:hypothetical protein
MRNDITERAVTAGDTQLIAVKRSCTMERSNAQWRARNVGQPRAQTRASTTKRKDTTELCDARDTTERNDAQRHTIERTDAQ